MSSLKTPKRIELETSGWNQIVEEKKMFLGTYFDLAITEPRGIQKLHSNSHKLIKILKPERNLLSLTDWNQFYLDTFIVNVFLSTTELKIRRGL